MESGLLLFSIKVIVIICNNLCRFHFHKFVKQLDNGGLEKAQLGLGHSYSRAKVKFNVNRQDNMIIQSIALLDQVSLLL